MPIYEQVIKQVQRLVAAGSLLPGDQIPSVRALSLELSINPNTIQKAYGELEQRGVTVSVPGVGRFVAKDAGAKLTQEYEKQLGELGGVIYDLALAGVREEDVLAAVRRAYKKSENSKREEGQH